MEGRDRVQWIYSSQDNKELATTAIQIQPGCPDVY